MEIKKVTQSIYHASMKDMPERIILHYGSKRRPHGHDTYELELDDAAWVEVLVEREKPKPMPGGWRLEE